MKRILTYLLLSFSPTTYGQTITTIAGTGVWSCSGVGGLATTAGIGQVYSVAADGSGDVYVSASSCRKVLKIDAAGIITTYAGTGIGGSTGDGGPATNATLGIPSSLAVDNYGNLFICDYENSVIRKVDASGTISTVAGDAAVIGGGYSGDGGLASAALLQMPKGIALDAAGNLYVADAGNNVIRKISTAGIINRVAGNGMWSYSGDGGSALAAGIPSPEGLAVDGKGNIFVSDMVNQRVRKINASGVISVFAGNGTGGYSGDAGPATAAAVKYPRGIAADRYGNVYIADVNNNAIRLVDTNNVITTYAGDGIVGHSGDGGPAYLAQINAPYDIAIDPGGIKYVAELNGAYVRRVDTCLAPMVTQILGDTSICKRDTLMLSDTTASGTWTTSDTSIGTIDPSGRVIGITHGIVTISYAIANTCATIARTKRVTVGPFAGTISAFGGKPGAGIDTFCYDAFLSVTGQPGGIWGLVDTLTATISTTGMVRPRTWGKADTAYYAVSDTCGSDTAYFPLIVLWCPDQSTNIQLDEKLNIYPNPATDDLRVICGASIGKITIVNMVGSVMAQTTSRSNDAIIDVSLLPPGIYVLKVGSRPPVRFAKQGR
jgi:hypothetical protein